MVVRIMLSFFWGFERGLSGDGLFGTFRNTFGVACAALSFGRLQLGSLPGVKRALGFPRGLIDLVLLQKLLRRLVVGLGTAVAAFAFDLAVCFRLVFHATLLGLVRSSNVTAEVRLSNFTRTKRFIDLDAREA